MFTFAVDFYSFSSSLTFQWLESQYTICPGLGLVHFRLHGFLRNVPRPGWRSGEAPQDIQFLLKKKSESTVVMFVCVLNGLKVIHSCLFLNGNATYVQFLHRRFTLFNLERLGFFECNQTLDSLDTHILFCTPYFLFFWIQCPVSFVDRQHCVQFTSSGRFQNLWKCSFQPQKTCWTRRTMVSVNWLSVFNCWNWESFF